MAAKDSITSSSYTARLDRSDVVHATDGDLLLPVLLDDGGQEIRTHLKIKPDDAARLHAQLDRILCRGWALTESTKTARQIGESHAVSGNGHMSLEGST